MGIAIISGVIASLEASRASPASKKASKWESHTPGTSTPMLQSPGSEFPPANGSLPVVDPTIPARFLACVNREITAKKLSGVFANLGPMGACVEIYTNANVQAVQQADVVLLW